MKIKMILTRDITVDAEVESIEKFCEAIKGTEWVRIGDGVIRTAQILAIVPFVEVPTIAEVPEL